MEGDTEEDYSKHVLDRWIYEDKLILRSRIDNNAFEVYHNGNWTESMNFTHKYFHEGYGFEEISEKKAKELIAQKGKWQVWT